jgi:hypothetical protein
MRTFACLAIATLVVLGSAQAPLDPVGASTSVLLDRGVLGAACVLLLVAVVFLFRALREADSRYVEIVIKLTDVLAKNSAAMETNARVLDRGSGSFPHARTEGS